ncbi:hypothetical protein QAD02_014787 [Eretmocerus hayati]|uniref:Uncharacterized protein n=1 Tax=Eretmocerus hayati TaxID=131215 RepID=A0ACC2P5Y7_9HYME|nr:hypothetical protein QAD02_014787 [Eretmocerus hayati]
MLSLLVVHFLLYIQRSEGTGIGLLDLETCYRSLLMISDIQRHHKFGSVFIVYNEDESLRTYTMILDLSRQISDDFVPSLTLNFTDMEEYGGIYREKIVKPLFVAIISSFSEVMDFQSMSAAYNMAYARWLVIFTKPLPEFCPTPTKNYFNLRFDTEMIVKCYGDPVIYEWYSFHGTDIVVKEFARWDIDKRYQLKSTKSLYERRNNLEGKLIRIATIKESTFITGQKGLLDGFFAGILEELKKTLNFSTLTVCEEDYFGSYNASSGQWSGAIGRLVRGEADLGVAEFTMTEERVEVVDFTQPILQSRSYLYMRQPDGSALQWSAYFRVFTVRVWIAMKVTLILASIVITYMRTKIEGESVPPDHISENYLGVWAIYCQQGLPDFPRASSMRIAYLSLILKAFIIYAMYSACLISYLALNSQSAPFKNTDEFSKDTSYTLMTMKESSDYDIFATSTDGLWKRMMNKMANPELLPRTVMGGFMRTCDEDDNIALYATGIVKGLISDKIECDLIKLESGRFDSFGMTLAKKSQYTGLINHQLQKFKTGGIIRRLLLKFYTKIHSSDNKVNPIKVENIITILSILGIGILLSYFILLLELLIHYHRKTGRMQEIIGIYNHVLHRNHKLTERTLRRN